MIVYRVQDADGRGPWRPGLSRQWVDADAPAGRLVETIFDLIPLDEIRDMRERYYLGCACRTLADLGAWFTPIEKERLRALRFHPVMIQADAVIAESRFQILIGRLRPMAVGATRLSWSRIPA